LGNGQPLNQVTTIVPIGRGPFPNFEAGAIDALNLQGANDITDWSIDGILHFLEGYNGYGYSKYHNMNSPYLWSGSNQYTAGKYVADGKFDPNAVSQQVGVALLLKVIINQ
jgi:lysozyme family protein